MMSLFLVAVYARADLRVRPSRTAGRIDVEVSGERVADVLGAIEPFLAMPVLIDFTRVESLTISRRAVLPADALTAVAASVGLVVSVENGRYVIRDVRERRVTLDVKDAPVNAILRSLREQCAIGSMMIAPDVSGEGTFLFEGVPCSTALRVVAGSMRLRITMEPNSVVTVTRRR